MRRTYRIGIIHFPFDLFAIATISIIAFLIVEVVSRIYNLYLSFPPIDIITHFLAGIAFFYFFYFIANLLHDKFKKRLSYLFTFIGAIIWELVETIEELVIENPLHLRDIFFWDGFFDVFFTLFGGIVALLLLKRNRVYFKKLMNIRLEIKKKIRN